MAVAGELTLRRNSTKDLKTMFKNLFEEVYYSRRLQHQKSAGPHILYIRLETVIRRDGVSEKIDLEEKILEDASNSNGPLSTLVIGDSGTGKSWLALKITKELYDSTRPEFHNKIPLYIPLGRVEKMIGQQKLHSSSCFRSDILFSYIMNHRNHFPVEDWKLQNLYLDLCDCELILILDGYDELKVTSNLWEENNWKSKDFKDVRTVVFCRPNVFVGDDISTIFGFSKKLQSSYFISPIIGSIVEKYISKVPLFLHSIKYDSKVNDPWMRTKSITKDHPKWESAEEDSEYKYWFLDRLPELQGLAQNVFILTTICQLLPKLVETERIIANKNNDVADELIQNFGDIRKIELLLYDRFTERWFKHQIERMEPTGHARYLYQNRDKLDQYMRGYAQNVAMHCTQLNRGMQSHGEISEDQTLFWNLWTPWNSKSKKFQIRYKSLEEQLFPQDEYDANEGRLQNLKFLRDSCLLRYAPGAKIFRFLHLSIFEYFLSREVFEKYRCATTTEKRLLSLFNFHRSRGFPSEGDAHKPFCKLFKRITDYQHSILITSQNEQETDLTRNWTVTVIAKKSEFKLMCISMELHAALIIEGILYGDHFVIRAELTRENKVVRIKCEPYKGKSQYEEIIRNYVGKQIRVDYEMGIKLLENIWGDTYNPHWKYNLLHHNCNSWCKEKLQVLNVEDEFKSKCYNCFADLPKDFQLREFKEKKALEICRIYI